MSYNSKYKGSEVDNLLEKAGTAIQEHQDISHLTSKAALESLQAQFNALVSNNAKAAIESFNEIIAFLAGVEDTETLEGIIASIEQQISGKVDKVDGKGLSTNDYTTTEKEKLAGIASGAEKNVQSDWNATSGDAFIKNKPTIPSAITVDSALSSTSTNPVQNKVINSALSGKYSKPSSGIPNSDLANSKITISGTSVNLGGSITQSALRTALGLGSNAYSSTEYLPASGGTVTGNLKVKERLDTMNALIRIRLDTMNNFILSGANTSGNYEGCLWPRFNNYTFLNFGTKGFRLRKNNNESIMEVSESDVTKFAKDVIVNGTFTNPSSLALKNIIDRTPLTMEQLSSIEPARFTWKDGRDNKIHIGAIADEVKEVIPEVVHEQEDGTFSMEYANAAFAMVASLVKYVEQNQQRIAELEKEIAELKSI